MPTSGHSEIGRAYDAVTWTFSGLDIIFVAIRLYTRCILTRTAGLDDLCIFIALCLTVGGNIGDIYVVDAGIGYHTWELSKTQIYGIIKWIYIDIMFNFICLFFLRMSIMLFVLKLIPRTKKWPFHVLYAFLVINFLSTLYAVIIYGIKCIPFRGIWQPDIHPKCLSANALAYAVYVNGALGCLTDFVTASVPILLLYSVQMKRTTKYQLYCIFVLGLLTASCSIGRAIAGAPSRTAIDPTYRAMMGEFFGLFEEKAGIIVACLPAVRQLIIHLKRDRKDGSSRPSPEQTGTTATTRTQESKTSSRPSYRSKNSFRSSVYRHLGNTVGFRQSKHVPSGSHESNELPYSMTVKSRSGNEARYVRSDMEHTNRSVDPMPSMPSMAYTSTKHSDAATERSESQESRPPGTNHSTLHTQGESIELRPQPSHDSAVEDFGDGRTLLPGQAVPMSPSDASRKV